MRTGEETDATPATLPTLWNIGRPGRDSIQPIRQTDVKTSAAPDRVQHAREAVTNLMRAIVLRDRNPTVNQDRPGLYELCLACALDDGAPLANAVGSLPGLPLPEKATPEQAARLWRDEAIRYFGIAFDRADASDRMQTERPLWGIESLVSNEAGTDYRDLMAKRGSPTADEQTRLARIQTALAAQQKLPPGPISPIIFSLDRPTPLSSLLSRQIKVGFDLDGTGRAQRYGWVRPDTAILAWDPDGTGRVTSGRQLLGNVTWWAFWDSGYAALAALDDNRDGWLTGSELNGLSLWFDRNGNGVSDPGEVIPIRDTPIAALSVRATGRAGATPMNRAGLRLRNGRLLPTYDWVAMPAAR
jgi:hypothetical protein